MGRVNHQAGKGLFLISFLFLGIFVLLVFPVSALEEVMDNDCNIEDEVFDRDWKKYSDLENTPLTFKEHPLTARSWETQQYYATQSEIVDAELQIFFLKRDMEIDRLMRLELKEYKKALVEGHRKNLLKSFCRLSFLTVHTAYEAREVGKSLFGKPASPGGAYGNLFTTPSLVSAIGSALKITNTYKAMAPAEPSALANNSQGITNVLNDATLNIALETVESLGDPKKIAVEVITQIMKAAPMPTSANEWKLTEDDFNILKTEHLKNKKLDKTIAESYKVNLERNNKVKELEIRIEELKIELAERETDEKSRVKDLLMDNCKNRKEGEEEEAEDEKCDSEHLCLCDNENDCMAAGGYWYDGQCNECPEEDISAGEFNCPIPAGAEHIVTSTEDYWVMDGKNVGPYQSWHVYSEKTEKESFACYDAEGKLYGVDKLWRKNGTLEAEYNHKTRVGKMWYENGMLRWEYNNKTGVHKWWHDNGMLEYEWNYKNDKKHGVCKGWDKSGKLVYECYYEEDKCVSCVLGRCE
ncbi:MAG: hypothetical protein U9N03_03090 [Candidatus Caldatribacteriota bacterium]|nr:hypothetical protein [Candidatus Caldatribacteriota bacterium]